MSTKHSRPFVFGVGFQHARLATIYPRPNGLRLDLILTDAGDATIAAQGA